jgi:hypothetical protein
MGAKVGRLIDLRKLILVGLLTLIPLTILLCGIKTFL